MKVQFNELFCYHYAAIIINTSNNHSPMRPIILLLLIMSILQVNAQETVKINDIPKKSSSGEIYHVLKSDKSIKHGPYELYRYGKLTVTGQFTQGQKSGLWKEMDYSGHVTKSYHYQNDRRNGPYTEYYSEKGNITKAAGQFTEDKESGKWDFFNKDGTLHMSFDFDRRQLLHYSGERQSDTEWSILLDGDTLKVKLDKDPLLIGNEKALMAYIGKNIHYPEVALENDIQGTVVIGFTIHPDGSCTDFRIVKDIGGGCGAEALRVLKLTANFWVPGEKFGEAVTTPMHVPVKFKMSR
jgi:TonB family protein